MVRRKMITTPRLRLTTIILVCSARTPGSTSIQFFPGLGHDIYLISNFGLFSQYVGALIGRTQRTSDYAYENLSIILVNEDISVLLSALELLQLKQKPELKVLTKERFVSSYKRNLTSAYGPKDLEFEVNLPASLADSPLGYDLCILQTCERYSPLDHLSESHVWTQQILRFLALKHGASFGAISGLYESRHASSTLFDFVDRIKSESTALSSGYSVFKVDGAPIVDDLLMHQFIPLGEDTWSKLILMAKSIPQVKKSDKIWTTELQFQELSDVYDVHLHKLSTGEDASDDKEQLLHFMGHAKVKEKKVTIPLLTFKDLLGSIHATEIEAGSD